MRIHHIDLAEPLRRLGGGELPALVIFWSQGRPVGEAYVEATAEGAETAALAQAALEGAESQDPPPPGGPPQSLTTSVVICTRDRPDDLARCLASLPDQSRPPDEVIVVDNASAGERTRQAALAAGARYVREDRPGLDIARNTGARAARGDIVAYTDDDVRLHPQWLERLTAAFEPGIMGVTGLVLPAVLETPAQEFFQRRWGFNHGYRRRDFGADFFALDLTEGCPVWRIGAGASMAFRREVFEAVGYFDERLDVGAAGCSGDSELWHRMLAAGMTCRYEPAAVAFHVHRREMSDLARQIRAYVRGHVAALLVQYEKTGNRGNLRRAFVTLPRWYAKLLGRRLRHGRGEGDRFLGEQIRGWLEGVAYYVRRMRRRA